MTNIRHALPTGPFLYTCRIVGCPLPGPYAHVHHPVLFWPSCVPLVPLELGDASAHPQHKPSLSCYSWQLCWLEACPRHEFRLSRCSGTNAMGSACMLCSTMPLQWEVLVSYVAPCHRNGKCLYAIYHHATAMGSACMLCSTMPPQWEVLVCCHRNGKCTMPPQWEVHHATAMGSACAPPPRPRL